MILGGTAEARALATLLVEQGVSVVSSLAGRVARPRLPVGEVRIGGFGGVAGLSAYLQGRGHQGMAVTAVVDATHPFAAIISGNAHAACESSGVPLLRLERPGWSCDRWHWVDDNAAAAALTASLGTRPFLTVGRQGLDAYAGPLAESAALVRVVDPPETEIPAAWTVLQDRGPYDLVSERALFEQHRADVLVTKDSGGTWTRPKLDVADELDVPVVIVRRPPSPPGVRVVSTPAEAAAWVAARG